MFHLVLYQPEIPPNTGNIIRLCANTGTILHLIEPLGFSLDDKKMKRAGLDYREFAEIKLHGCLSDCLEFIKNSSQPNTLFNIFACTTKGRQNYTEPRYQKGDVFIFGPETRGLPQDVLEKFNTLKIPMMPHSRSLNLSNSAAVILYEALRQQGFGFTSE